MSRENSSQQIHSFLCLEMYATTTLVIIILDTHSERFTVV